MTAETEDTPRIEAVRRELTDRLLRFQEECIGADSHRRLALAEGLANSLAHRITSNSGDALRSMVRGEIRRALIDDHNSMQALEDSGWASTRHSMRAKHLREEGL